MHRVRELTVLAGTTLSLLVSVPSIASGQELERADSYYHFSIAKLHDQQMRFADAISEFEKALGIDSESSRLHYEFARTLYRAGAVSRATEECKRAIELDPADPDPHFLLAQIYKRSVDRGEEGLLEEALAEFRNVIELNPRHADALFYLGHLQLLEKHEPMAAAENFASFNQLRPHFPQGYNLQARALLEANKVEEAIAVLEESRKTAGEDPANLELLGRLYEDTDRSDEALSLYRKVREVEPSPELTLRLATLLSRQGSFEEAIPLFRELVDKDPDNPLNKVELGKALEGARQYQEAIRMLEEVLDKHPDLTEANYYMASSLRGLGRRKEAIERVSHLLDVTTEVAALQDYRTRFKSFLGILYQEDRQYEKAVETFREICREAPHDGRAKLGLAYALEQAGHLDEALELSDQLMRDRPEELEEVDLVITKARILSVADRLEEAVRLLEDTLGKTQEEGFYLAVGQLYSEHKQYAQAEVRTREGLKFHPENDQLKFQLASMLERQGRYEEAETEFQRILESNPEHAAVLNYLGYMLAELGIRLDEARDYIERALKEDPHNGAYLDSLGWVHFKLNNLELAEANLTRAAEVNGTDSTILEHLGDLYRKMGDHKKAQGYYEKSVSLADEPEERERVERKLKDLSRPVSGKPN